MADEARNACLCHDMKWRAKYHYIINKLHGKLQIEHLKRIPRVICACKIDTTGPTSSKKQHTQDILTERWAAVSTESITAARQYFEHLIAEQDPCEEFHGFLKNFRDRLMQDQLLSNSQTSASRFMYILQELLQNKQCSIMDPICTNPQTRKIHKEVIVLSPLRPQDVGNFIGRKGVRLRKLAAKGSKIDIKVNTGTKNVEAHIVCLESAMHALKEKLEKEAIQLRKSRDQHEEDVCPTSSKKQHTQDILTERWAAVSTESITAARQYFEHLIAEQDPCEEFHGFLKNFRDRLMQDQLLSNSQTSASRFMYILQELLQNKQCSIMDPICTNPQTRKIHKEVIVLSPLRPQDVGNFIGRKGVRLRKLAGKGSKIDIKVNTGTKNVEAHIVCLESAMHALKEKLEKEAIQLRKSRDQHEEDIARVYCAYGVFPTNMPPEKSRAYIVAKALGANIQTSFIPKVENNTDATTHVVAALLGTIKVRTAQKAKGVQIVSPNWLWSCAERYEKVDERLFELTATGPSSSRNSPEVFSQKARNSKRKAEDSDEISEEDSMKQAEKKPKTAAIISNRPERFSASYNPLFAFSDDDIACMDKEVEDIMDESDGNESDEDDDERDARFRSKVLSLESVHESSSEDSMTGDFPRGWKAKGKKSTSNENSPSQEKDAADVYVEGGEESENELDKFEKTVEAFAEDSASESDDGESIGSVDDEMAAAVEREFLSL